MFWIYSSTSFFVTLGLPAGTGTSAMSIPFSFATRLAAGEAKTLPSCLTAGTVAAAAAGTASASCGASSEAAASAVFPASIPSIFSPGSPIIAIGSYISSVSFSSASSFNIVPDSGDSKGTTDLSDSISAMISPFSTCSPMPLTHFVMTPSVIVSPSLGMFIKLAILHPAFH